LLSVLSTHALLLVIEGRRRVAPAYVLITAAALLTQYYAVLLVAGQMLALVFLAWRAKRPVGASTQVAGLSIATAGLPFLIWMIYAAPLLLTYVRGKLAFEGFAPLDPLSFVVGIFSAFGGSGPL